MAGQTDADRLWECFHIPGKQFRPTTIGTTQQSVQVFPPKRRKVKTQQKYVEQPSSAFTFPADIRMLKDNDIMFSVFDWEHLELARKAVLELDAAHSLDDFMQRAVALRAITNPDFYNYVLTVAALKRPDTKNLKIPSATKLQPHQFFPVMQNKRTQMSSHVMERLLPQAHTGARRAARPHEDPMPLSSSDDDDDKPIEIMVTGTDQDPEHRAAYFREDIGLNSHHSHWHIVYNRDERRDRAGELFYYMHRQMLARYDNERMSVGLKRVQALDDWDEPIPEGYETNLTDPEGNQYAVRPPGMKPNFPEYMNEWKKHILKAIEAGHFLKPAHDGGHESVREPVTIDLLGGAVEPGNNPDENRYGKIHNTGHVLLAKLKEDDDKGRSVIGFSTTAARDPLFYRWHKFVDGLFETYQQTRTPYTDAELCWDSIEVKSIKVLNAKQQGIMAIKTFLTNRAFDVDFALDNSQQAQPIKMTSPHIDHEDFSYKISVKNATSSKKMATVRIFMAPKLDDGGDRVTMDEYRTLCIELDKFTQTLVPGDNTFRREALESSVSVTWDNITGDLPKTEDNMCGCGWPHHLLVPRGKTAEEGGTKYSLFVMLSDWEEDRVQGSGMTQCKSYNNAISYCGKLNEKYPDRRAMGFPFDRPIDAPSLDGFTNGKPNMKTSKIQIVYTGRKFGTK